MIKRGGKCEHCGYNNNLSALEFHHKNPKEKEFQVDVRAFSNYSLEKLEHELDRCELLCSNCHKEIHYPDLTMYNIPELIKNAEDKKSFSNKEGYRSICPVCGTKFPKSTGKIYCSKECRLKSKGYPSIDEINKSYELLGSWEKVAQSFDLTRKIIQGIRKRNS